MACLGSGLAWTTTPYCNLYLRKRRHLRTKLWKTSTHSEGKRTVHISRYIVFFSIPKVEYWPALAWPWAPLREAWVYVVILWMQVLPSSFLSCVSACFRPLQWIDLMKMTVAKHIEALSSWHPSHIRPRVFVCFCAFLNFFNVVNYMFSCFDGGWGWGWGGYWMLLTFVVACKQRWCSSVDDVFVWKGGGGVINVRCSLQTKMMFFRWCSSVDDVFGW